MGIHKSRQDVGDLGAYLRHQMCDPEGGEGEGDKVVARARKEIWACKQ